MYSTCHGKKALQMAAVGNARMLENFAVVVVPSRVNVRFNREVSAELSEEQIHEEHSESVASASVGGEVSPELWVKGKVLGRGTCPR